MSKLDDARNKLNKRFGEKTVRNPLSTENVGAISTGSLNLDMALGIGGLARDRINEIIGWEATGKTTLAINAVAEIHKEGGVAAYIDMEHAFMPSYAKDLGVEIENEDKFLFSQPENGEQALEVLEEIIRTGEVSLAVVDSVAALIPEAEMNADAGDNKMGLHARLMSQTCRKISPLLKKNGCTVIFINQYRKDIGVSFGSGNTTTGGNALKFYGTQRIELSRVGTNKDTNNEATSNNVRAKVIKNKVAPPFKQADFVIAFGEGVDTIKEIISLGIETGIMNKSGSWYSYNGEKLGQGEENVKQLLKDNPEMFEEIQSKVKEKLGI